MAYEMESIQLSQKLFYTLLCNGKVEEETQPELYRAYVENEEVMNLVKNQGEVADCSIERYGNVIYIMPNMSNTYLGFSKSELKRNLCRSGATDKDYYLSQFIILTLLAEFYDGQGNECRTKDHMKTGELQNLITERLKAGKQAEEKQENRVETGLDYHSMSAAYEALRSGDKKTTQKTTKEGLINNIMDFLEQQDLVTFIKEDEMIKPTMKLDHIMAMKLLNKANYERVMMALGVQDYE